MLATLTLTVMLATSTTAERCSADFQMVFARSVESADKRQFLIAAALRESAADLYQDCFSKNDAPKYAIYPFDGIGAYLVAGDFWHLSGNDLEAQRCLSLADAALKEVRKKFRNRPHDDAYEGHLGLIQKMLHDRQLGKWGAWR